VPSNLILDRVGARRGIARIMITWGMVSASFVYLGSGGEWLDQHVGFLGSYQGGRAALFYTLRFLLGAAEAGFYPGIILYLTQWYPSHRRARVVALFMTAIPISGIIGGPLSGWIMASFSASAGWAGWQWLFR
jgi:MFS family permease